MKTKNALILCLSFAVPAALPVFAGDHGNKALTEFPSMDTNADGKLSPEESAAAAERMFAMMDADKDGRVTASEMTACYEKMNGKKAKKSDMSAADKIAAIDRNGDGILTASEHATGAVTMFGKMDTNLDGFVSKDEMEAGHKKMLKKHGDT